MLFLSKHAAASGRPCLTVHPIGVPHLEPEETPPYGGRAGEAPPPSPRLAAFWRALQRYADDERIPEFEVSLEVTHHGPWQHGPAAFLEVGSTAATWAHAGAAEVWADVLLDVLRLELEGGQAPNEPSHVPVLVTLGGGTMRHVATPWRVRTVPCLATCSPTTPCPSLGWMTERCRAAGPMPSTRPSRPRVLLTPTERWSSASIGSLSVDGSGVHSSNTWRP